MKTSLPISLPISSLEIGKLLHNAAFRGWVAVLFLA
jgi:hypothetical protein